MHFKPALLLAALAPTTILAALSPQGALLISDIRGIDYAVRSLTAKLQAYQGGINASAPISTGILAIHAINRQGFTDAKAAAPLPASDSQQLVAVTNATVGQSIPASIAVTKAKKPLFKDAYLVSLTEAALKLLLYDHLSFSGAVGEKLTADQVGGAASAAAIAAAIQDGVNYYATR